MLHETSCLLQIAALQHGAMYLTSPGKHSLTVYCNFVI
jgi:hypothetical protein